MVCHEDQVRPMGRHFRDMPLHIVANQHRRHGSIRLRCQLARHPQQLVRHGPQFAFGILLCDHPDGVVRILGEAGLPRGLALGSVTPASEEATPFQRLHEPRTLTCTSSSSKTSG